MAIKKKKTWQIATPKTSHVEFDWMIKKRAAFPPHFTNKLSQNNLQIFKKWNGQKKIDKSQRHELFCVSSNWAKFFSRKKRAAFSPVFIQKNATEKRTAFFPCFQYKNATEKRTAFSRVLTQKNSHKNRQNFALPPKKFWKKNLTAVLQVGVRGPDGAIMTCKMFPPAPTPFPLPSKARTFGPFVRAKDGGESGLKASSREPIPPLHPPSPGAFFFGVAPREGGMEGCPTMPRSSPSPPPPLHPRFQLAPGAAGFLGVERRGRGQVRGTNAHPTTRNLNLGTPSSAPVPTRTTSVTLSQWPFF